MSGRLAIGATLLAVASCAGPGTAPARRDGFAGATEGLRAVPGFVPLFVDDAQARVLAEVPPESQDVLWYVSLPAGLGSNDVGLDRGQISARHLVRFRRAGPRILLYEPNLRYRSSSPEAEVQRGVRESFAPSVLFAFDVVARDGERVLVDATDFFLRDAHGVAARIAGAGQGRFELDPRRSVIETEGVRGFAGNTEVGSLLTFTSDQPGAEVRNAAASGEAVTLRVRHSFVRLAPLEETGYSPRAFDPRCGYFPLTWSDPSAPIDRPLEQRWITRHRLRPGEPIVYFIDRAAPEPVRTALLEGARYWERAFAEAGLPGAFRAELLPEGADLEDVSRNVVTWVSRTTRGWSYGDSVTDPRTGEILKGHVSLGALRVRQDVLLFEGLLSPYTDAKERDERVRAAALARIRQLAAHEIGHTLGLAHNFAASTRERASVMDYPAPRIGIRIAEDGTESLDLGDAYRDGCGPWDVLAIRYGYLPFGSAAEERAGLSQVLAEMRAARLVWLSDADARGTDRAHPEANLWDDGADALEALRQAYEVRRVGLEHFGPGALAPGRSPFELERALVPLYLHHRYQLEAAVRAVGGRTYGHGLLPASPEEAPPPVRTVDGARQRAALELVLESLTPAFLRLPRELVAQLPPPPPGYRRDRESFEPGAFLFDPLAPTRAGAQLTLSLLFDPARLARVLAQEAEPGALGLDELFRATLDVVWSGAAAHDEGGEGFEVRTLLVDTWLDLASRSDVAPGVRSRLWGVLRALAERLPERSWQRARIERFLETPEEPATRVETPRLPPGSPIGASTPRGEGPRDGVSVPVRR